MSVEIQGQNNEMLHFKKNVSLTDFTKAMGHFNKLFRIFAKRDATYVEFTAFLEAQGFVEKKGKS